MLTEEAGQRGSPLVVGAAQRCGRQNAEKRLQSARGPLRRGCSASRRRVDL